MPFSLPARPRNAPRLTEVVPILEAAIAGESGLLPPVRSAVLLVADGLGARNLAARRAHGRFLGRALGKHDIATTVFPSTTSAALTSLLTGTWPGEHGVVGYRALNPQTGTVVNQLHGWDDGKIDPATWQRSATLLGRRVAAGFPAFAVSKVEYQDSGFTQAIMRGAEVHGTDALSDRVDLALHLARSHPGALVYLYVPELDAAGHRHGWESAHWAYTLEEVDSAVRRLHEGAGTEVGVLVTADHGMVDVPAERHVLFGEGPLTDGVRLVGGEPRMLHLYTEPGAATSVHEAWLGEQHRSWVMTREEAIAEGLFGPVVDEEVVPRIGDVLVAARARIAYYDDRLADTSPRSMIGQHGSLTDEETTIPFLRLGAFTLR